MAGFYEEKGMVRYTMILPKAYKEKIEQIAKAFKITQGEVVEVLLDQSDINPSGAFDAAFVEKRASKATKKSSKRGIIADMKNLSPEDLAVVAEAIAKVKAEKKS